MNRYFVIIGLSLLILGCSPSEEVLKNEILETDLAFSALSKAKGSREAFVFYAADEVIKPQPNRQPLIGKDALIKSYEGINTGAFELTWEPLKADVSGNLGYTFGNYILKTKTVDQRDTVYYGNYVSIWRKQPDGVWKYVFDSGNPTPAPSKLR